MEEEEAPEAVPPMAIIDWPSSNSSGDPIAWPEEVSGGSSPLQRTGMGNHD
ncbi:MAG: hypothetical protein VKN56_01995 [Cyanobacteriota bacterium]|nr:hypothetical protein [Cyanobacteriota bacterium]